MGDHVTTEAVEYVEGQGGTFKLTIGTGRYSGLPRVWLGFMAGPDAPGYGVFEDVTMLETRQQALDFIETPPAWWGKGCATCSGSIVVGPPPTSLVHHTHRDGGTVDRTLDADHPPTIHTS